MANKIHYSEAEKRKILQQCFSWPTYRSELAQIASVIDSLTFADLRDLVKALQMIAKGKR